MRYALLLVAALACFISPVVSAQEAPRTQAMTPDDLLRRKVEGLSRIGRGGDAIELLEKRRAKGDFTESLARHLVRLYREAARWEDIETLLLEMAPDESQMDFGSLRQLADARFRLDRIEEAERTLERAIELDPEDASRIAVISNIYVQWGQGDRAIEVLVDARERMGDPLEFAQSLSRQHARRGDGVEAMREACRVVAAGPLNLAIMRGQVVQIVEDYPALGEGLLEAARSVQDNYPQVAQLKILVAEIALSLGEEDVAWGELRPLIAQPALGQDLLRIAIAGLADSRLPDAESEDSLRRLRLSVRITRGLLGNETLPRSLEPRAHDTLVRSLLGVLDNQAFAGLGDEERGVWLEESRHAVLEMNTRFPGNRLAAAATLRLAEVYTDALGESEKAIELFDAIAEDPSSSSENILIARLGLARAYVVAGDTLRARQDLMRIGADKSSPAGQSRAHYHLGLLDFMGGEFAEAEDRFKAVALRAPRADYTNDALDLAILIAEEQLGGAPDEEGLRLYGVMLYMRATHQREAMATALIEIAERDPSPVRDRSRINLAKMYRGRGEPERALVWLDRLVEDSPESRTIAEVLDLRADLLMDLDRPAQASEAWERILLEHENYVMIDRVRDRLADLQRDEEGPREGEVP
jgi:tetratricopeptide (TPR) repeat protein